MILEVLGLGLVMVMGCAMDSASIIPGIGVLVGLALMAIGVKTERR